MMVGEAVIAIVSTVVGWTIGTARSIVEIRKIEAESNRLRAETQLIRQQIESNTFPLVLPTPEEIARFGGSKSNPFSYIGIAINLFVVSVAIGAVWNNIAAQRHLSSGLAEQAALRSNAQVLEELTFIETSRASLMRDCLDGIPAFYLFPPNREPWGWFAQLHDAELQLESLLLMNENIRTRYPDANHSPIVAQADRLIGDIETLRRIRQRTYPSH